MLTLKKNHKFSVFKIIFKSLLLQKAKFFNGIVSRILFFMKLKFLKYYYQRRHILIKKIQKKKNFYFYT